MSIPALLNSSLSGLLFPQPTAAKSGDSLDALASRSLQDDVVALSAAGQGLLGSEQEQAKKVSPAYQLVAVDQRPSPQQSADVILGFIANRLQSMAADGADPARLESAYNQAVAGFQKGLEEAKDILQGMQMMTDEVASGIAQTEKLVTGGLAELKQQLLGSSGASDKPAAEAVVTSRKVVEAYREQSTYVSSGRAQSGGSVEGVSNLRGAAAAYADSYRRDDSVSLNLRTQDGDIVTLRFSSALASDSRSSSLIGGSSGGVFGASAYERNSSFSVSFSMSVQGNLDAGETDALNALLEDVSALSDEFFNGDFDKAFAMAMEFEMDATEFSAMSLDISRSSSASMVEAYTGVSGGGSPVSGLNDMVDQLLAMLDKASNFADPKLLLTDLIANKMAQQLL